jgi:hypothetical protein
MILPPLVFPGTTHSSSLEVQGFEPRHHYRHRGLGVGPGPGPGPGPGVAQGPGVGPGTGVELRENSKNEALFIQSLNEYLR